MPKALSNASLWHYVSLAAGLTVILVLQTSQWFFFDEWAFLQLDGPGLLEPHVGHWSTSPMLVFDGLRAIFGLHTYFPYVTVVTLIHLAIAHLVWRVAIRSGASPWIATTAVTVFVFLGAGAENILWAFQIGFLGAIALGMLALWLATTTTLPTTRFIAILFVSLFALTWAGTAIPLIVGTAFVLWRRHGWPRALLYGLVCASVYLAWYLLFALHSPSNPDTGGLGLHKLLVDMPLFLGVMFVLGFGKLFPLVGLGALLLIAVGIWLARLLVKKVPLKALVPALALLLATACFALLTSYSRALFSLGAGQSSRYVYTLVLLLLPLLAVALTQAAQRWRYGILAGSIALAVLAGYQATTLVTVASEQSATEEDSHRELSAALSLYEHHPADLNLDALPDAAAAPDLSMSDLVDLYEGGLIDIGDFTAADLRNARRVLG